MGFALNLAGGNSRLPACLFLMVLTIQSVLSSAAGTACAQTGALGAPLGSRGDSLSRVTPSPNAGDGTGVAGSGLPGGAAMADFDTLINLIQQTVDPDSWLAAGGTSSILPYPSGVYVDPVGHLERLDEPEPLRAELALGKDSLHHPWKTENQLRVLSLAELDRALADFYSRGLPASPELLNLAGLSKIEYVKLDPAAEDVLIAGPTSGTDSGFQLQDLAVVAALVGHRTTPWGCTIEPGDDGLRSAQDFVRQPGVLQRLARNPRLIVEQMQDRIGPHQVQIFGMSPNTGTAVAMVDADEHMKKVGFGTVRTPMPINSYFDYLDQQNAAPAESLIRWWFAYADTPIQANAAGDIFRLPEMCVAVRSEQQWVTQNGRAPTGRRDAAADAFAEGMTRHLARLRSTHPSYARLCAVFEMGLALQLAIESTGLPSLEAWFPTLCQLGASPPADNVSPRTVSGLTTWHRLESGNVVAVVSGGVKVDPHALAANRLWRQSKFLVHSLVPSPPERRSVIHGRWWWDQR